MTISGSIQIQLYPNQDTQRIRIALTDHFSMAADKEASRHAVLQFSIDTRTLVQKTNQFWLVAFGMDEPRKQISTSTKN